MKTQWTCLLIGGLSATMPALASAQTADLSPMAVRGITGNMHLHQSLPFPCGDVNGDIPVIGEWLDIAPAAGLDIGGGHRGFLLNRGTVRIDPFSVHVSCLGHDETQTYSALSVEIAQVVPFDGVPSGTGIFTFTIPAADVLLYETATVNGGPEDGYKNPRDPVTGTINFGAGTIHMNVVVATRIHVDPFGDFDGDLTAGMDGTISFPDADGDGVPDGSDNCPLVANPDQSPVASPVVKAPSAVVLNSCAATHIGQPVAADVCFGGPLTVSNNAPHPYPLGSTVVTWTAVDSHSNVGTDTQTVTIVDTTPPVFTFVPANINMNNCGPANLGLPTATDDCGGSPTFTNNAPPKFFVGTTPVTWTATDISGNHATATQTVTVVDTVPPDVFCVPVSDPNDRDDRHDIDDGFFRVSSTDACTAVPTIRIGTYVLANGETIKIEETHRPGVRLDDIEGRKHIKEFHAGHGQGVITSTDASSNVGSVACPVRHEREHEHERD